MNIQLLKKTTIISFLYSMPLIFSSFLYLDDIFRATSGWMGYWLYDARPVTYMIMQVLNLGNVISDIAPLPTIISIFCMSLASTILASKLTDESGWIVALAASALTMSPLYIENLSYAFDGMTMSLSILMAIFATTINFKYSFILKIALSLAMLCTYQPSIAVYTASSSVIAITSLIKNEGNKEVLRSLFSDALSLIISYVLYKPMISSIYPVSDYFFGKSNILRQNIFNGLINNIANSFNVISSSGYYFWLMLLTSLLSFTIIIHKIIARKSITSLIIATISSLVLIASIIGPVALTTAQYLAPRVFVGFSVFSLFSCVVISQVKRLRYITILPGMLSVLIMYTYVGAMRGEEERNNSISNDIQAIIVNVNSNVKSINIEGNPGFSNIAQQASNKFKLIDYITPKYFDSSRLSGAWLSLKGINIKTSKNSDIYYKADKESVFFLYGYEDGVLHLKFKSQK